MSASQLKGRSAWLAAFVALALMATGCAHRYGRLIIEDLDVVAWMPFNNTFMNTSNLPPEDWNRRFHRDGVLIQIGDYDSVPVVFEALEIERKGQPPVSLPKGSFTWIDIVAEDPNRPPRPMDTMHAGMLWPDPSYTTGGCNDVDSHFEEGCVCPAPPCDSIPPIKLAKQCLRLRSLHGYLTPFAAITYWQGPGGFQLLSTKSGEGHVQHTFVFKDKVEIYKDGSPMGLGSIDAIRITHKEKNPGTNHGGYHSPPWKP